jgi:DNA-binding SARP family transcriptional activator
VLLSALRDVLQPRPAGDDPLISTGGAVSLNRALVSIDVDEFPTRATAALSAERSREPDVTARLAAAVAAHTGDFLEDDPYHEWAAALAEEIRATHIALLRALAARLHDAGDTDAVVQHALCLLEQDCYDEEAHLNLVGVLLHAGRLAEARRRYESYVRRMTEIGMTPRPLSAMTSRRQPS